jgi:hypothetical protein
MTTKRQRKKRRRRQSRAPAASGQPIASASTAGRPGAGDAERPGSETLPAARGPADPPRRLARRTDGPPPAPWGSFPLTELVVLVALIMLVGGFFVSPPRGAIMIGTGLVLGSLAGLELSAREHFAGYRSHTLLLGGAVGMLVFGALFVGVSALHPAICAAAGALAFGGSAWFFASAFRRRSGGALYKIRA